MMAGFLGSSAIAQESTDSAADRITRLFLQDIRNGDSIAVMREIAEKLVNQTRSWSRSVREQVTEREAKAVARALLLPVLILEISFCGLRVLRRQPLTDQLARLTGVSFIAILVLTGVLQGVIVGASDYLADSGRNIGALILRHCRDFNGTRELPALRDLYEGPLIEPGASGEQNARPAFEPLFYWCAWLGSPPTRSELEAPDRLNSEGEFKFAPAALMRRIWNYHDEPFPTQDLPAKEGEFSEGLLDYLQRSGQVFLQTFFLLGLFLLCLTIAAIQAGAYLAILFATLSILLAAFVSFDLIAALGYATLPLIYFPAFDRLWAQYLVTLVGLTLIPFFYYLCSAIGFVFATTLFEILFPAEPSTASFAQLLSSVYLGTAYVLVESLHTLLPQLLGTLEGQGATMIEGLVFLGKILAGSLIVASFVGIGVGFAALAPLLAMRWHCGFSGDGVFDRIAGGMGEARSAFATGIGGLYRGVFEHGGRWLAGLRQKPPGS